MGTIDLNLHGRKWEEMEADDLLGSGEAVMNTMSKWLLPGSSGRGVELAWW